MKVNRVFASQIERVLAQHDKVQKSLSPETIHHLRRAIRRCRSMVNALRIVAPGRIFDTVKGLEKSYFKRLGRLRDIQVMTAWVKRLSPGKNPAASALLKTLHKRETKHLKKTWRAMKKFHYSRWIKAIAALRKEITDTELQESDLKKIALEHLCVAHKLHQKALRTKDDRSLHRLRIAIKKLRYFNECFLPVEDSLWGKDLKLIQDLLGAHHDLQLLWEAMVEQKDRFSKRDLNLWRKIITREQICRFEKYRRLMTRKASPWQDCHSRLASCPPLRPKRAMTDPPIPGPGTQ